MKRVYPHLPTWLDREIQMGEWMPVGRWIENTNDKIPDVANFDPSSMGHEGGRSDKEILEMVRLCSAAPLMYAALMVITETAAKRDHTRQEMEFAIDCGLTAMEVAVSAKKKP